MVRQLNTKLLLWLLGSLATVIPAAHQLHSYQVKRHVGAQLRQAEEAESEDKAWQAVVYLRHCLEIAPDDAEVLARYGLLLDKQATTAKARQQVLQVFERVLRKDPARHDVRRRVAALAMELEQYADAVQHLRILRESSPRPGEWEALLARCHAATAEYVEAAAWWEEAIQLSPKQTGAYVAYADLLQRRLHNPKQAVKVLDTMVAANSQSQEAYLARARYRQEFGPAEGAAQDLKRAAELAPTNADVLLAAAEFAQKRGHLDEARECAQRGLEAHPRNVHLYSLLAILEVQSERLPDAVACLRRGLKTLPDHPELLPQLAELLIQRNELAEADAAIARLRKKSSSTALPDYLHVRALMSKQRWAEAVTTLEGIRPQASAVPALFGPVNLLLGQCHERLRNSAQALAAYRRAVAAEPSSASAHLGLASALLAAGRSDDALSDYRQAMALSNPPEPRIIYRVAQLLCQRRRYREAEQVMGKLPEQYPLKGDLARLAAEIALYNGNSTRALALARSAVPAGSKDYREHLWQAQFLVKLGRQAEAQETLRRTVQENPGIPDPWVALVECLARANKEDQAHAVIEEARRNLPPNHVALALARCYDALARIDEAEEQYNIALGAKPDDFFVLQAAASFYLRLQQFQKAETYLHRLLEPKVQAPPENMAWARRQLALGRAVSGNDQSLREALALLDQNAEEHGGTVADERARAMVLGSHPDRRQEAIRLFEASMKHQSLTPQEQYQLAQLYEATGEGEKAREQLVRLLAGNGQDPLYLCAYVRHLLRRGEIGEAERWVARLEQIDPRSVRTTGMREQVLKAQKSVSMQKR